MCKWCEQTEDGGIDFKKDTVKLGAIGKLEITSEIWNFGYTGEFHNPFLLFDVWFEASQSVGGFDLCDQKMYINYCPFCGKKLVEE